MEKKDSKITLGIHCNKVCSMIRKSSRYSTLQRYLFIYKINKSISIRLYFWLLTTDQTLFKGSIQKYAKSFNKHFQPNKSLGKQNSLKPTYTNCNNNYEPNSIG